MANYVQTYKELWLYTTKNNSKRKTDIERRTQKYYKQVKNKCIFWCVIFQPETLLKLLLSIL